MKPSGTVDRGELWVACENCDEDARPGKKVHKGVRLSDGVYHCFKCGDSGRYSLTEFLNLYSEYIEGDEVSFTRDVAPPKNEVYPSHLVSLAGSSRPSALPRYQWVDSDVNVWDAFMRYLPGVSDPTGVHLRRKGQKPRSFGTGYSWPTAPLLTSSQEEPLRLVEGPYDVVGSNDLCVYGTFGVGVMKSLLSHFIVLCPDGDIWQKSQLRYHFSRTVAWLLAPGRKLKPYLLGMEYLSGGRDPDEVPIDEREFFDRGETKQWLLMTFLSSTSGLMEDQKLKSKSHRTRSVTSTSSKVQPALGRRPSSRNSVPNRRVM